MKGWRWIAAGVVLSAAELLVAGELLAQTRSLYLESESLRQTVIQEDGIAQGDRTLNQLPPLIDRQTFFGNPQIYGAKVSPNGQYMAFIKPIEGTRNIWVKGINQPMEAARPLTASDQPVTTYFWSADGQYILYIQDKGGNENYHIYVVEPTAEPAPNSRVPQSRDLTPLENVKARIYAVPESTPDQIVIGLNDRNPQAHDVYRLNLNTGERTLLFQNDGKIGNWVTDLEGNLRLASRLTQDGSTEILQVEGDSLAPVYRCSPEETCNVLRFHKDGDRVYMTTNKGEEVDLLRLVLFNPQTQEVELVSSDPEAEVDFSGAIFAEDSEELIATVYISDRKRIYPQTQAFAKDLETLQNQLPDGNLSFGTATEDGRMRLVSVDSDVNPGITYLFNRETDELEKLYETRPELPTEHLASMQPIRYTARDGTEIPAYLTLPKGIEPRNLPVVIHPHGGPWTRDTWGYRGFVQLLANRGYAVLQPNFRGSAGYGQSFLNAGNQEWGTGVMQHDISDGVKYLIDQGIADPNRVAIHGASYGGYATLAGLTFTPELYTAGISYVGVSNLITWLKNLPPYWAPAQGRLDVRVGDLDDPQDRERLRQQSPLFHVEQIDDPLLVIQGANDPRVPKAESDQIVAALNKAGQEVNYLVAPNEGHGFQKEANRLAVAAAIERFLAEHLGGRYQEEISPQIQQRLEALRVNVNQVNAPEPSSSMAR